MTTIDPEAATAQACDRKALQPDDEVVLEQLERTLTYARVRDYTGWDYGDGMSSRVRRALPVDNKWVNVAFQEVVKRSPLNVRPLLLVEQRRNVMGAALFTMANITAGRLVDAGRRADATRPDDVVDRDDVHYRREAQNLADWLVEQDVAGYDGYCVGYPHPIQHLDGRGEPGQPDVVNTSFAVKALLRASALDSRYAEAVADAGKFPATHLNYEPVEDGRGAVVDYHDKHEQEYYTINAGALCARLYLDLYDHFGEADHRRRATELLDHVADLQTDRGGWLYRDPPEASHLSMDTHHNGFVVECFQRFHEVTGEARYEETLDDALRFFRRELFEADGAPNFDEESAYPRDIHASVQGVLVFTYAGDLPFARRILQWAFDEFGAGDGRFYYRKERFFTKRQTLMRWCQAWMAFAMAEYLDARTMK